MSSFIGISHGCIPIEERCDIMGPAGPTVPRSMEMQAQAHEVRGKTDAAALLNYKDAAAVVALTLATVRATTCARRTSGVTLPSSPSATRARAGWSGVTS